MNDERELYGFTWPGKREAILEAGRPIDKVLRPCVEESENFEATENLYIEGDNLEAMKILQRSYMRKVKMIYIDPPYNTGHDFIYSDDFAHDEETAQKDFGMNDEEGTRNYTMRNYRENTRANPRYHSDWCSMIYPRLRLASNLLRDDGVIFISIDDNEVVNLRKICDEIFDENNFVANLVWKGRSGRHDSKYLEEIHEYILCYAKNIDLFSAGGIIQEGGNYPKYDAEKQRYYKTQLLRKWGSNSRREDRPNLYYPITAPDGSEIYPMTPNGAGRWRWSRETMNKALHDRLVEFVKVNDEWIAYEKVYAPAEGEKREKRFTTWIDDINNGTETLKQLFTTTPFDYSKSPNLILRLMKIANLDSDSIVLDFFAGSSTTAHAVMSLNASDSGHRKFIMIQLPEPCPPSSEAAKAGYSTIAQLGRERIRRASRKLAQDFPLTAGQIDSGFRTLRVDSPNFRDVFISADDIDSLDLDSLADNLKPDRSPLDLLFMCITDSGLPLSLTLASENFSGFTILTYGDGEIIACFDSALTEEVITHIAKQKPQRAIFRDSAFQDSQTRINLEQIFRYHSPDSDMQIL
ncbi:MAG: site-specific DNA-methyltransferase [Synergistaceae bacterium]|nr:site-specific DNA-methyltransferase [Synergistaceae bacterium]